MLSLTQIQAQYLISERGACFFSSSAIIGSCILVVSPYFHTTQYKFMRSKTSFVHVNPSFQSITSLYPTQPKHPISPDNTHHKRNLLQSLSIHTRSQSTFTLKEGFQLKLRQCEQTKNAFAPRTQRQNNTILLNEHDLQQINHKCTPNKHIYAIIYVKQYGMRIKMNHCFVRSTQIHNVDEINSQIRNKIKQLSTQSKKLYLFHIDGAPLLSNSYNQKQKVFLVNIHPHINLSSKMRFQLIDAARLIQERILQYPNVIPYQQQISNEQQSQRYDWMKIKSVQQYVNSLSSNPQSRLQMVKETPTQFMKWCGESFKEVQQGKPNDRNPLFQASSHYSQQASNQQNLHEAATRLDMMTTIHNLHKIKALPLNNLIEKVKRESNVGLSEGTKVRGWEKKKREMWRVLENKHHLLSEQNIPYLIEKYGVTRYEIYKLFNLYKGLEKVSCLRKEEGFENVLKKGVGRGTFDESLKRLDMHPGDELIKGVTFFPDFIKWEDFLKIVSISLRKTPQEKLEALLQGISAGAERLTAFQIGVMVGSSLTKLFDSEQTDLKTYFTKVAMTELDPQNNGSVCTAVLKKKVLNKGSKKMDIVSFLILNS